MYRDLKGNIRSDMALEKIAGPTRTLKTVKQILVVGGHIFQKTYET